MTNSQIENLATIAQLAGMTPKAATALPTAVEKAAEKAEMTFQAMTHALLSCKELRDYIASACFKVTA